MLARAFGLPDDLSVDFTSPDRPTLVTQILAGCLPAPEDEYWWQCTVSQRTAGLLRVLLATDATDRLNLHSRCQQPNCQELLAFDVPLSALLPLAAMDTPMEVTLANERRALLRRPTGTDLRRWRQAPAAQRDAMVARMIESLWLAGDISCADTTTLVAALCEADPLVAFAVNCTCPACGADMEVGIDLEAVTLGKLRARQDRLLREFHLLASHYGWSEGDIAALPAARRARYVALIEGMN